MTATQNFTLNTTATFNAMTVAIASGFVYRVKAAIVYRLDGNSNGINVGISFPAARRAAFSIAWPGSVLNAQLTAASAVGIATAIPASVDLFQISSGTAGVDRWAEIDGTLLCTGTGKLVFYARAEVAAATAKIMEGSNVIVWQMGTFAT
jgi:hypothetical protein